MSTWRINAVINLRGNPCLWKHALYTHSVKRILQKERWSAHVPRRQIRHRICSKNMLRGRRALRHTNLPVRLLVHVRVPGAFLFAPVCALYKAWSVCCKNPQVPSSPNTL